MENSAQDSSSSAQEASCSAQEASDSESKEIEEAIDAEMSALSVTEDKSMSGAMFGSIQCEDQENTLYKELDLKMPYIIYGIENGYVILLHKNSNGNLEDVYLRSSNRDVSHANTVVEPCSAVDKKEYLDAVFTHIQHLKAYKFPKGVVFNSRKLCLVSGKYRENFEYTVQDELGEGLYGKVKRIFDKKRLTTFACKKIPILDFREEEVLALNDLSGTGVSPDFYGLLIEGNYVYVFMEEITDGIPLSRLIPRFRKSVHRALIVRNLLYDLLVALFKIHSKWWKQNDLHEGNILIQIEQDASIRSRIIDFGEASYTKEDADFRKEYEQVGKLYKDILTAVSEESKLDKTVRNHIQSLMKVSDITEFRQNISRGYAKVQLPRDVEEALQKICSDAAGFKAANSDKDPTNFKEHMKYSMSGGSTASKEPLLEQDVFKWLDEHPDSFKKYQKYHVNREVNSIQESIQDPGIVKTLEHEKLRKVEKGQDQYFQDLNTHQDHADSKVFARSVVRGNIHQASSVFRHDATGTQCTTICAIAAVVAVFKKPLGWSPDDIDMIVSNGDQVHVRKLTELGWPVKRTVSRLGVDELPKGIAFIHGSVTLKANIDVMDDTSYNLISHIDHLVKETVKTSHCQSFILTMLDKCRAILHNGNGCYSVFDPHSCDASGFAHPTGTACVLHFDNIDGLVNHLKNLVSKQDKTQQVDLTPCNIKIQLAESQEDINLGVTFIKDAY